MRKLGVGVAALAVFVLAVGGVSAHADAAVLMEEPYGDFGAFNPTGHAAIYLNHICAESPTQLRPCRQGEPGAVISRYHKIDDYDWIAIPLVPYLYAVDRVEDVPATADAALEARLRDQYRRDHLLALAPDREEGKKAGEAPKGESGPSLSGRLTTAGSMAFRSRRHQKKISSSWTASMTAATTATSICSFTTALTFHELCSTSTTLIACIGTTLSTWELRRQSRWHDR